MSTSPITRRDFMTTMTGMATLTSGCAPMPERRWAEGSLQALAMAKGARFGSCIGTQRKPSGRAFGMELDDYRALVARECALLVPENELKWQSLQPSEGVFRFEPADRIAQWAGEAGLALRGHTLLWHAPRWMPPWLTTHDYGPQPAQEAERLMTEFIATCCRRYGTRIGSWDVVNESVVPETGALHDNAFTSSLGNLGQIELAFQLAHEHAPHAQLVYNDFMTWGAHSARHRAGVLGLLQRLRARGTPVHALGLQSHLGTGASGRGVQPGGDDEREWRRFLDEVAAMGLTLLITELDVNDRYMSPDITRRDAEAAALARGYLDVTLSVEGLRDILAWGLADHVSWMRTWLPRADGLPKRSTPYDETLRPKPLREAIAAALRTMPMRRIRAG